MKWIVVFLLMIVVFVVAQEQVTFVPGKSYVIDDRNITLVKSNDKEETAVFCVNGFKGIALEDKIQSVNDVYITLTKVEGITVDVELDYRCDDCICDETCNNQQCFDTEETTEETPPEEEVEDVEDVVEEIEETDEPSLGETLETSVIEQPNVGTVSIVFAVLIIVVLALGLFIFWKRN